MPPRHVRSLLPTVRDLTLLRSPCNQAYDTVLPGPDSARGSRRTCRLSARPRTHMEPAGTSQHRLSSYRKDDRPGPHGTYRARQTGHALFFDPLVSLAQRLEVVGDAQRRQLPHLEQTGGCAWTTGKPCLHSQPHCHSRRPYFASLSTLHRPGSGSLKAAA